MVAHPKVAEAAVVGVPHDIKGQGIYVYVLSPIHISGYGLVRTAHPTR